MTLYTLDRRNKLPELQAMLYQQEGETVFGIEYGVALHPNCPPGNFINHSNK